VLPVENAENSAKIIKLKKVLSDVVKIN